MRYRECRSTWLVGVCVAALGLAALVGCDSHGAGGSAAVAPGRPTTQPTGVAATQPAAGPFWWDIVTKPNPTKEDLKLVLANGHPRLVFRPEGDIGRTFSTVRKLYGEDPTFKSIFDKALAVRMERQDPAMAAVAWIVTGDDQYARAAIDRMVSERLSRSAEPSYSNMFIHALAYDWLFHHPYFTAEKKAAVVAKIVERLTTELADLDDTDLALWHGRNQAANGCIITALAIGDLPGNAPLLRRAAAHYVEVLRALRFSEGWPEGASYWIYNRAGPFALAADCVMTGLGRTAIGGVSIPEVMGKIGYWQLYQYAPNGTFEPYGDSAGSLHLGETGWWELTTDHYARLSGDPGLMAGADYLRNHSPDPYGRRSYFWHVALTYDPAARPKDADYDPAKPELWMRQHLRQAMLFGRGSYGVAFFRGDWGDPDEAYATFKAGDMLAHHDHYDTGSFSIQRGGNLAPRTGFYGNFGGDHRLGYYVQTVAVNSLLVLEPNEFSSYLAMRWPGKWRAVSGGQRVIRATSFNCVSLDDFRNQLHHGPHLKRADITQFESRPGRFDYIAADITAAYNSTIWSEPGNKAKVSLVTRQFLYLRDEQAFVVYDRVEATDAKFEPRFLLHANSKPQSASEELVQRPKVATTQMAAESGIYQTADQRFVTEDHRGRLTHLVLLPRQTRTFKIGGPEYCFYVENDGDEANGFNGTNLTSGAGRGEDSPRWVDQWRVEVGPSTAGRSTRFLNVLLPRLINDESPLPKAELLAAPGDIDAAVVGQTVVVFSRSGQTIKSFNIRLPAPPPGSRVLVLNAQPSGKYESTGQAALRLAASAEGVLEIEATGGDLDVRLSR